MRYIQKSLHNDAVPFSLRFPHVRNFVNGKVPQQASTTHEKREKLLEQRKYDSAADPRYKYPDIKVALDAIYFGKCVFCEQEIEQYQVEHYRPKQIYYWLALSWDNLLCVCPFCNVFKSTNFDRTNPQASLSASDLTEYNIHGLGSLYDQLELPMLVNPEVTNPDGKLEFDKNGALRSQDARFQYTIDICKISRSKLNDKRKAILDEFRKHIKDAYLQSTDPRDRAVAIKTVLNQVKDSASDEKKSFTAFRRYLVQHWLAEEIKAIALP